ncbi:MAG: hypothetical protein HYT64_01170 [Candidatus Yanofskybacteria bacterium]|nr:hypothetical protein [Candidatus Yanofskybacteria bacterium]
MAEKAIDLDEIQELTERSRQEAERREQEHRLWEDRQNDAQAKEYADKVIAGLPERIKAEARKGSDYLMIDQTSGLQLRDRVKRNITNWCWINKLSVTTRDIAYYGQRAEEVLVISWSKKK